MAGDQWEDQAGRDSRWVTPPTTLPLAAGTTHPHRPARPIGCRPISRLIKFAHYRQHPRPGRPGLDTSILGRQPRPRPRNAGRPRLVKGLPRYPPPWPPHPSAPYITGCPAPRPASTGPGRHAYPAGCRCAVFVAPPPPLVGVAPACPSDAPACRRWWSTGASAASLPPRWSSRRAWQWPSRGFCSSRRLLDAVPFR